MKGEQNVELTDTQKRILEVGKREFLEKGFKDASLRAIVKEAGFTKGPFMAITTVRKRCLTLW